MYDVVIVLGARVESGKPSRTLAMRLDRALEFPARLLVVSGGGTNDVREADVMADYLQASERPHPPILRERESGTTQENVAMCARLAEVRGRVAVVTSDFHVWRTRRIIHDAGLEWDVIGAKSPWLRIPKALLRELGATLLYACSRIGKSRPRQ